jgi:hypothetical protein
MEPDEGNGERVNLGMAQIAEVLEVITKKA